ncbi:hypothetical protein EJ110_NYTH19151 [Nymphaea thermarum]|nr:hypothetical protein EJ110_NYTH19151 [Nymphaea thermarum]
MPGEFLPGTTTSQPQIETTLCGLAKFFKDVIDVRMNVMIDMNVYVVACALPWATMQMDEIEDERPVGGGYVIGRRPVLVLPLVSPVRSVGGARPQGTVVCCAWSVGSLLPNLGVLGKVEYLSLKFTHPWMSALPLQRMKWIYTVMGHHGGCLSAMEYQRRGKKRVEPSIEAQRESSPAHSDAHTPQEDNTSGQLNAQASVGAQTPPRQTPPVDQQALLLMTLQTLTSIVQSKAGNQRSQASPTGDTTAPPKEKATTVSFHHFMTMQPPVFTRDGNPDKAEEWIEEIERIFEVLEVPGGNKVKYGSYMLKGDAQRWWKSTREIQFADQQTISWRQFRDSFFSTYFPVQARNKKMQEFLDLQQNHLSLKEYVTNYRHLEAYCPHLYTTAEARADKFIYGLRDGLRGRVMSSSPRNLDEAVTRARRMEEDWARTQRDHQKKASQHTQGGRMPVKHHHPVGRARPYERRDDRTFRRNRPGRGETTQGLVASPTSPRCPTCSRAHPGKPCYRMTEACLHCGSMRHFIKDCPLKKERDLKKPEAGPSSVAEKKKTEVMQAVAGPTAATTAAAVATTAAWVHWARLDDLELKDSKLEAF